MKTLISAKNKQSLIEEIKEEFKKNTMDGICSHVKLNTTIDNIPSEYIVIGIIQNDDTSFEGVLIDKEEITKRISNKNNLGVLSIKIDDAYVPCIIKIHGSSWQPQNGIGVLKINTYN